MKIRRRGDDFGFVVMVYVQAAALQQCDHALEVMLNLVSVVGSRVTVGRCVDQAQQPFACVERGIVVVAAVVRADVHCWCGRHGFAHKNIVELAFVVAGKEHVVPVQWKTAGLGGQCKSDRGK